MWIKYNPNPIANNVQDCAVRAVNATADPTVTPAPIVEVQNANLTIARIA